MLAPSCKHTLVTFELQCLKHKNDNEAGFFHSKQCLPGKYLERRALLCKMASFDLLVLDLLSARSKLFVSGRMHTPGSISQEFVLQDKRNH